MASLITPLNSQVEIVDGEGKPTPYFTRLLAKLSAAGIAGTGLTSSGTTLALATMAAKTILANKTSGTASPTACTISDILDFITTTRGSILFRGASGWQALAPDTAGKVLQTNGTGADPTWATASGGSSNPWYYKPPLAANFSTMYASLRGGTVGNALSFSNDTNVGLGYTDPSTENSYIKAAGRPIPVANRGSGTTFTFTVKLASNSFTANDQMGIWVRASSTQYIFLDFFNRGGSVNLQRAFYNAAWNDGSFTLTWEKMEGWLRIAISNQTTSYYVSIDGKFWTQIYSSENLFSAPFTDYGFCYGRFSTTSNWYVSCDSLTSDEYP